jgi:PAS domain S-box-containing protein
VNASADRQRTAWTESYDRLLRAALDRPGPAVETAATELGEAVAAQSVPLEELAAGHLQKAAELINDCRARPLPDAEQRVLAAAASVYTSLMKGYGAALAARIAEWERSARYFRDLLDYSQDVIYRTSLVDRSIEYASKACLDVFGCTHEEFVALGREGTLQRFAHPDDWELVRAVDRPGGPAFEWEALECRIRRRDGQYGWILNKRSVIRDPAGRAIATVGVIQDITERKRTEEELQQYRNQLEELVAARTAELEAVNRRLQAELAERTHTEAALRASEERYRLLAESMTDFVSPHDTLGHTLYVSPSFHRVTGYTPQDIAARDFHTRIHPDDRTEIDVARAANLRGEPTRREYRGLRKDGSYLWLEIQATPLRGDDGQVERILCCTRVIDERKRAEEALRRREAILTAVSAGAEALLRAPDWRDTLPGMLERLGEATAVSRVYLFENHAGPGGALLTSQRFEWAAPGITPQIDNPQLQAVSYAEFGFDRWCEVLGSGRALHGNVADLPASEQAMLAAQDIRALVVVPVLVGSSWWGFIGFDECTCERTWSPAEIDALRAAAGTLGAAIQRQRAGDDLRASEERFRVLCTAAPVGIFLARRNAGCLYVNPRLEVICGLSFEECLGYGWLQSVHPEDREAARRDAQRAAESGTEFRREFRLLLRDGRVRCVHVYTESVLSPSGQIELRVGIIEDITERKQAEEAARQRHEQMAHLARVSTMGEMASGLAHELAQPLSAILYYARGAAAQLHEGRWGVAEATSTLHKIADQAERAGHFIRGLKAFVQKTPAQRVPTDLNAVVREAVGFAAAATRYHHVTVETELTPHLPPVHVDRIQIEQVMLNLIHNGVEAMETVAPAARRLVVRTFPRDDGAVCAAVRDSGPGLSPEAAVHIFDPFVTTKPKGTGLGLSISRSIIEDVHEGAMWVVPNPGDGAEIGFALRPAAPTNSKEQ